MGLPRSCNRAARVGGCHRHLVMCFPKRATFSFALLLLHSFSTACAMFQAARGVVLRLSGSVA